MNDFTDGAWHFVSTHSDLVLNEIGSHMLLSVEAVAIAVAIGVPLGVWLGHIHRLSFLAINISNLGRALPSVAILAILLPFTGIGTTDVIIALVVLAFPPILTNSYVAVEQVDADTVDAAKGIGLRPWQVLARVEIPLALPLIFAGIRTSSVFVVATATLAGIFGGGGLGDIISNRESYGLNGVIAASYIVILLAFAVQILFFGVERLVTPAGLRRARDPRPGRSSPRRSASGPGGDDAENASTADQGEPSEDALASVSTRDS